MPTLAETLTLSPLLAFVIATSLHLLIAYALSKLCEMVTGAMGTSGEANYTGPHSEEYVPTRPGMKRQRLGDAQVDDAGDDDADLFYKEPTNSGPSGARVSTRRVPSFELPEYNVLFEKVKPAPTELMDLTKFSVPKMYSLYYNLHAVPQQMSEELVTYSWVLGTSNFALSRALHASFYRKNQLPQEIRRIIVNDRIMQGAYNNPHQVPEYDETEPDIINVPIKQGGASNLAMPGQHFKSDVLIHKIPIWQVITTQHFNNRLLGLSHGTTITPNINKSDELEFKAMLLPSQMAAIFEEGRTRSVAIPTCNGLRRGDIGAPTSWNSDGSHGRGRTHSLSAAQGD